MSSPSYPASLLLSSPSPSPLPSSFFNESEYIPYHLRPETYIVPILFALIFIVGTLGNGVLIYIFIRNKTLRNVPNIYIISLSVGDLLVILVTVPFVSTVYTLETWPYGLVICKFSEFVKDISVGVSVFTLTALSADRYFAIVNPMRKHMGGRESRATILVAAGVWLLSILLALPAVIFSVVNQVKVQNSTKIICYCTPYPEHMGGLYPKLNVLFKFLVYYAIPLIVVASFYILMARHLLVSSQNLLGETQQQQQRQIEARKKVAFTVLVFVTMFAICFFPHHVFVLWFYFYPDSQEVYDDFWHALRIIGFCFSFINSCINPIALYCVSRLFRKYYNRYLFCCCVQTTGRRLKKRRKKMEGEGNSSMANFNSTIGRASTSISTLHSTAL
uniref:G-protein coupled receptors family 1 profile domain-containing protein n=1 Tax=Strigamia maritima TaxID=126957 RepID=T1IY09_STRMM